MLRKQVCHLKFIIAKTVVQHGKEEGEDHGRHPYGYPYSGHHEGAENIASHNFP